MIKLYTYFRSSAAFRVRIALNYKELQYQSIPVHLLRGGGEQHSAAFGERNPARMVPVLEDGALTLTQSLAIIEYLEETHPATGAAAAGCGGARQGARAGIEHRLRYPSAQQRAGAALSQGATRDRRSSAAANGRATGSRSALLRSSVCWRRLIRPGTAATAMRRRWPIAA